MAIELGEPFSQYYDALAKIDAGPDFHAEADRLLNAAAAQNFARAEFELGELFLEGKAGWPQDAGQAGMWLTIAAEAGCLEAPVLLKRLMSGMTDAQIEETTALSVAWKLANPDRAWTGSPREAIELPASAKGSGLTPLRWRQLSSAPSRQWP